MNSFLNTVGVTVQTPQTLGGLNLSPGGGDHLHTELAGWSIERAWTPTWVTPRRFAWPRYGHRAVIVNANSSDSFARGRNANALSQTMTIGAGDVDPADQVHIRFVFVRVLDGNHSSAEQSYYFIQVTNVTQSTILYTNFGSAPAAGSAASPP